jgi:hypothetical protein
VVRPADVSDREPTPGGLSGAGRGGVGSALAPHTRRGGTMRKTHDSIYRYRGIWRDGGRCHIMVYTPEAGEVGEALSYAVGCVGATAARRDPKCAPTTAATSSADREPSTSMRSSPDSCAVRR